MNSLKALFGAPILSRFFISLFVFAVGSTAGASVTYTYTGNNYTYGELSSSWPNESGHGKITFSLTVDSVLPQGLLNFGRDAPPGATWSISDGYQSWNSADGVPGPSWLQNRFMYFQLKVSSAPGVLFDEWYIDFHCPDGAYACIIQSRNNPPSEVGDWSQLSSGQYGGNWDSPGTWVMTSSVPIPSAFWLLCSSLFGLAGLPRKGKSG